MAETRTSSGVEVRAQRASRPLVRRATAADIPALRALGEAVVPPTYGPIDAAYAQRMLDEWWIPEVFEKSLACNTHLVTESDGEVVALATFGRTSQSYRDFPHVTGDREVMWKLYVHPDHQGRGIGRRLLAEVEALVEGDALWLEVVDGNRQAYDFYRAHGFEEVERVGDGRWPDDVWMRKHLGRGS
jgi:ribosomal protein S18 acetylase RimI-like enzyme